jgi:hypothetical protein
MIWSRMKFKMHQIKRHHQYDRPKKSVRCRAQVHRHPVLNLWGLAFPLAPYRRLTIMLLPRPSMLGLFDPSKSMVPTKVVFFFVCSPFCERFSQVDSFWKDFKKWTLSSAPCIMAPRLHASAPQIIAPRSWA